MATVSALDPFGHSDDGAFLDITTFADHTRWLNGAMVAYSSLGMVLFLALIIGAWWRARNLGPVAMTRVIAVPVAACVAYAINDGVKLIFDEHRPCYAFPHAYILEACPAVNDYSFPSNHTAVALAMAMAFFAYDRRFGVVATIAAIVMAFSRVYDGAHYPHDVLIGAVIGVLCGILTTTVMVRHATGLVDRLGRGRFGRLVA